MLNSMRFWGPSLVLLFVLAVGWFGAGMASAQTLTASGKIHLRGVVVPAHYVIVDDQGTIIKIISNTKEDTVPLVFSAKIDKANARPLTDDIYKQYQKLVPTGTSHQGTLYDYQKLAPKPAEALSVNSQQLLAPRPHGQVLSLSLTLG